MIALEGRIDNFGRIYKKLRRGLLEASRVDVGTWHAQDVSDQPLLVTRELQNLVLEYSIPPTADELRQQVKPNLPFADAQFADRVSGEPLNPPPSASLWPYAQREHEDHLQKGKFSHTYPERFWPKTASEQPSLSPPFNRGIRYPYGDLGDVIDQLVRNPYTRQAYLPVWFPEDTGKTGIRLPCTLGYHFLFRGGKLDITYFIRSVDFVRHFRDDVYMACRLCQWVVEQFWEQREDIEMMPGNLTMHICSLHCMEGDLPKLRKELDAPHK